MIDQKLVKEMVEYFELLSDERDLTSQEKRLLGEFKNNVGVFTVSCVMRDDLEEKGFDTEKISDETMSRIADKMGDSLCETGAYWDALECWGDYYLNN